ncbi:DEBR0S1_07712g1_1 [Brettanomyces bruxellensis]|uniref:DEBR0S1_07712g1_1 n=1 Tax=Dekkera bruxellensis TaxID=5007 RepID=A0A7D9GX93_DEKBR|nr:DEBR0S1_07712g1_1 [Brettanomyces bruxellensis]
MSIKRYDEVSGTKFYQGSLFFGVKQPIGGKYLSGKITRCWFGDQARLSPKRRMGIEKCARRKKPQANLCLLDFGEEVKFQAAGICFQGRANTSNQTDFKKVGR